MTDVLFFFFRFQEDWKPSFITNEEFAHLMLEALEGFIFVFGTDGAVVYASESITSLLGYLPGEVADSMSIYEMVAEADKPGLYSSLMAAAATGAASQQEVNFVLHMRRGGLQRRRRRGGGGGAPGIEDDDDDLDQLDGEDAKREEEEEEEEYELVRLSGYFRKWTMPTDASGEEGGGEGADGRGGGGTGGDCTNSDDDSLSCRSGFSRFSGGNAEHAHHQHHSERTVFVSTARLLTTGLLREIPLVHSSSGASSHSSSSKNEFTSRYSLEWKFLFLDHRAPQVDKNFLNLSRLMTRLRFQHFFYILSSSQLRGIVAGFFQLKRTSCYMHVQTWCCYYDHCLPNSSTKFSLFITFPPDNRLPPLRAPGHVGLRLLPL